MNISQSIQNKLDGKVNSRTVLIESLVVGWERPVMDVYEGYDGQRSIYRSLTKKDLITSWLDIVNDRVWLKGHTYQVCAEYKRDSNGHKVYLGLYVRDTLSLFAGKGQVEKVFEVEL